MPWECLGRISFRSLVSSQSVHDKVKGLLARVLYRGVRGAERGGEGTADYIADQLSRRCYLVRKIKQNSDSYLYSLLQSHHWLIFIQPPSLIRCSQLFQPHCSAAQLSVTLSAHHSLLLSPPSFSPSLPIIVLSFSPHHHSLHLSPPSSSPSLNPLSDCPSVSSCSPLYVFILLIQSVVRVSVQYFSTGDRCTYEASRTLEVIRASRLAPALSPSMGQQVTVLVDHLCQVSDRVQVYRTSSVTLPGYGSVK